MKIKAKEEFSKLGSANNWASFGKEKFVQLESGKAVEVDNCPDHLFEDGYVEEVKSNKKKESK
jgi:hypothetical protein